jgi:uncharacterized protein
MTESVVVAGVTTRALAVSAARAGFRVTAVDAFGDIDLRMAAEVIVLRTDGRNLYSAPAAAAAASSVSAKAAAYTSNFENYPAAVARLAAGRRLLGNPPDVLSRVRDPIEVKRVLRRNGFASPRTHAISVKEGPAGGPWLLKPRRSGGGHGIRHWRPGQPVPRAAYLQERIAGTPGSIVFAADGRRAVLLGLTRQLVGDPRFGSDGFRYCGSLLGSLGSGLFPRQEDLRQTAVSLAAVVTAEFGLVGLNGLDFVARDGVPYPVEINPRFSASMELIEKAHALSMFQLHAWACRGALTSAPPGSDVVWGKAIVFARRDLVLGDTRAWDSDSFADIPHPGEHIGRGHPICTVFAQARDAAGCYRRLARRAESVYRVAESRRRGAA